MEHPHHHLEISFPLKPSCLGDFHGFPNIYMGVSIVFLSLMVHFPAMFQQTGAMPPSCVLAPCTTVLPKGTFETSLSAHAARSGNMTHGDTWPTG
jgi:hypothetical protein